MRQYDSVLSSPPTQPLKETLVIKSSSVKTASLTNTLSMLTMLCAAILFSGCDKSAVPQSTGSTTQPSADQRLTIAVIPKGTTHAYWKSLEVGANVAGKELGVDIKFIGPMKEDDSAGQEGLVEQFVADNISGIVLAPLSDVALLRPVQSATEKKIPVVIIDSALKGEVGKDFISYVSTDNKLGGKMAGDEMARILNGKGKLVLLRYTQFSASTNEREAGFLESIHAHPDITLLVENRYAGATESDAQQESENLLDQLRQADGIFCPNESSVLGMLKVLEQNDLAGKVHFVGFDSSQREMDALRKGEIDALIAQNPVKMGYLGVKTCVEYIRGSHVETTIDTGVQLINRDNLNSPEVVKLLSGK
jgi:ribose transport system substrate-binding protein